MTELSKEELEKAELATSETDPAANSRVEESKAETSQTDTVTDQSAPSATSAPTDATIAPESVKTDTERTVPDPAIAGATKADHAERESTAQSEATKDVSPKWEATDDDPGEPELDIADPARPNPLEGAVDTSSGAPMVLGLFDSADALMDGIKKARAQKLGHLEAYTPYPIHGIDDAIGLRRSPLGAMVMVMGIIGALTALGFQIWVSAVDYPIVTGGKPPWSWEAFVPIMFEVTVLFATFTAGLGMLFLLNKLPFFGHPVLSSASIKAITRDKFALSIESTPGGKKPLDTVALEAALRSFGASSVESVKAPPKEPVFTSKFLLRSLAGVVVSAVFAGVLMYGAVKLFPVLPPMVNMLEQPALKPQRASTFFADGRGMRMPATGTVARGHMPLGNVTQDDAAALVNPLPRTEQTLLLGKQKFTERCAVCHGALANGNGSLTAAYGAKPANLQSTQFREYSDGQIYWVIVNGKNAMPSQAADLSPDDRWAVVHYVRALQRAQNAKDEDIRQP